MQDPDYEERVDYDNEEYFDRSGCGPIASTLLIIFLFWVVVCGIYLFT